MTSRALRPGRVAWAAACIVFGVLSAAWFIVPTRGTAAQNGAPPVSTTGVDPRWLALLQAERRPLEGAADLEGVAAGSLTLHALINAGSVSGFSPTGSTIQLRLTRPGTAPILVIVAPQITEMGWWYTSALAPYQGYETSTGFKPGDVIEVIQGTQAVSMTVTTLEAFALADADVVTGTAQPASALTAYLYSALDPQFSYTATSTTSPDGVFTFALGPTANIQAGDTGWVRQSLDAARSLTAFYVAPQIHVAVGTDFVSGLAAPNREVTIRALSGDAELAQTFAFATSNGVFGACLSDCGYGTANPLKLNPGERVEITTGGQTVTMTVPVLTAQADRAGSRVFGVAIAGQPISLNLQLGPSTQYLPLWPITFDAQGAVTATSSGDYSAPVTFRGKDQGLVVTRDATGHLGYVQFAVPYLSVALGAADPYMSTLAGRSASLQSPLTITVLGPSGLPKAVVNTSTSPQGEFSVNPWNSYPIGSSFAIESGDVITVETPAGVETVLPIPTMDIQADVRAQRLSGQGPAGARLALHLDLVEPVSRWPSGYDDVIQVGSDGRFELDLSTVTLLDVSTGSLKWMTLDGHELIRSFRPLGACLPLTRVIVVGGNTIEYGYRNSPSPGCTQPLAMRLLNAAGFEKARFDVEFAGNWFEQSTKLHGPDGQPLRITAGDRLIYQSGDQVNEWVIPDLFVTADAGDARISGRGPAGAVISLTVFNTLNMASAPTPVFTTTVGADGRFASAHSLTAGDLVQVQWLGPGAVSFVARAVVPGVSIALSSSSLAGLLLPLEPYTFTLQTTRPVTPTWYQGRADDQGLLSSYSYPAVFLSWWGLQRGDRVIVQSGTFSRTVAVARLTARYDSTQSTISGETIANRPVVLSQMFGPTRTTTTDASGRYVFAALDDVFEQSRSTVAVILSTGDRISVDVAGIRWGVNLGTQCVDLILPNSLMQATLEIRRASGALKTTLETGQPGSPLSTWTPCLQAGGEARIEGGDRLVLLTPDGTWSFTVPGLSARHDPKRRVVVGTAPAGQTVVVSTQPIGTLGAVVTGRSVPVDPTGQFGVDISDATWHPGQVGAVGYIDQDGNTVVLPFTLTGIQHWLPWIGHP